MPTCFDPHKEHVHANAPNLQLLPRPSTLVQLDCNNDGDGECDGQWSDIDHVAGDDAEVEDLVVEATHAIQRRLLLVPMLARTAIHSSRIELAHLASALYASVEEAALFFVSHGCGL